MDWFLYDNGLRHERVNRELAMNLTLSMNLMVFHFFNFGLALRMLCISQCFLQYIQIAFQILPPTVTIK